MKRQSWQEMSDMLFQFAGQHNLSLILRFHNEFGAWLKHRVAEIDESLNATGTERERLGLKQEKATYSEVLDEKLRCATFLMLYAHAEEWFFHVWKTYARTCKLDPGKGSIQRFTPILRDGLGLDQDTRDWQFLCDAERIRDCLLHANGRVSLIKKPAGIKQLVQKHESILGIANDRLRIEEGFLRKFKDSIDAIMAAAEDKADEIRGQQ